MLKVIKVEYHTHPKNKKLILNDKILDKSKDVAMYDFYEAKVGSVTHVFQRTPKGWKHIRTDH